MRTAPENSKYRRNRRYHMLRKFTLIELLIIISIIIIISGLLLPAMRSALNKAESIQCINNLKQTAVVLGNLGRKCATAENSVLSVNSAGQKFKIHIRNQGGGLEYI